MKDSKTTINIKENKNMGRRIKVPRLLPKPEKIIKRGIYEIISNATGGNTKPRDYGKRIEKGGF